MSGYSLIDQYYYYSNPSSNLSTENHHNRAKKPSPTQSMASEVDFTLSCFDLSPFEDFFSAKDKWLCRVESSFFSSPFKAIEHEPFTITDRTAMEAKRTPFNTTIRRLRSTIAQRKDSCFERVEKTQFDQEDYLHDLADRIAALEITFDNLMDFKATKNQKALPSFQEKSFEKKWHSQDGGKAKVTYKCSTKALVDPITIIIPGVGEFKTLRAEKCTILDRSKPKEAQIREIPVEQGDGNDHTNPEQSNKTQARQRSTPCSIRCCQQTASSSSNNTNQKLCVSQNVFVRKRAAAAQVKGKKKELSPQDAALIIQARFREYLVHRSQTLRSLRDLAVAKAKLKELRSLFTNYAYRRHLCRDPEEKQRFSEKTIVLLLTVDSIQGSDHLVREARKSMIQELESMLDAVDPQPSNKGVPSKRRKFDLPDSEPEPVHKEMEMEVAEVVRMLDEKNGGNLFPFVTL